MNGSSEQFCQSHVYDTKLNSYEDKSYTNGNFKIFLLNIKYDF